MARKLLFNAQRPEEVRVAITNQGVLDTYAVSTAETGLARGNIYRGVVANLQPSLDAAFVDFGAERHGLLRAEDIVPSAAHRKVDSGRHRPRIDQLLEKGRPILVQVVRDGIGTKGALLTTNLSIAGRYLVLMPFEETRGISRKLEDGETRGVLRERLGQLSVPDGIGVIARTNAGDQPKSALNRDLSALLRLWKRVRGQAAAGKGPRLLYSDQDLILQVLRDSLDSSIDEVLVDDDEAFDKVRTYMQTFMPRAKTRLTRYAERMPLFSKFDVEPQIERIYQRKVSLPSGGSIVIDGTEALTAIDVNSGRSRGAASQEDTAVATNLEAASEVARQLRLRDIGGLMVVDFIDMR
jgi:ribonuclease E